MTITGIPITSPIVWATPCSRFKYARNRIAANAIGLKTRTRRWISRCSGVSGRRSFGTRSVKQTM